MTTKHEVSPPRPATPPTQEDSHAFSLDVLRARETTAPSPSAQAADDSGVIDLDSLRLAGPPTPYDDLATSRLVAEPMLPPPPSAPRWAVATLGLLGGAVVALSAMVTLGMPAQTVATQDPLARPTMAAAVLDTDTDARVAHGLQIDGAVIPHMPKPAPAPAMTATLEPEAEPVPVVKARSRSTSRSKSRRTVATRPTPAPATPPAPKQVEPKSKANDADLSVQCILDPGSCGVGAAKPKAKAQASTTALPAKLTSSQIRTALTGPKAQAKKCGDMHAAPAGTTVKVKLSIAGSGAVRTASPQAPHANGLGRCVADALADATFDPFGSPAMGVVYSVRL